MAVVALYLEQAYNHLLEGSTGRLSLVSKRTHQRVIDLTLVLRVSISIKETRNLEKWVFPVRQMSGNF